MGVTETTRAMRGFAFRLYVAGESPNSVRAIANLGSICRECLPNAHTIEIVDVLDEPLRPLGDGILVTPTLVKLSPLPVSKIMGDLNERAKVLLALGIEESET